MKHHITTDFFKIGEVQLSYQKNIESPFEKITCSKSTNNCIREIIPLSQITYREHMYVLYLDNANKIIGYQLLHVGGITATMLDIRILLQGALLTNSVGIVLFHNHPSGKLYPSQADIELTRKVKSSTKLIDIKFLDHIIITASGYYSFSDEGNL